MVVIWGSDYACTPDHSVTCSRSSDMINHGNFLYFPSLAQQTPRHTTSRHSFLNELPCQRRPFLPDFGRGSDDLCKRLDDCKGKWGTPTRMTHSRKEPLFFWKILPIHVGCSFLLFDINPPTLALHTLTFQACNCSWDHWERPGCL